MIGVKKIAHATYEMPDVDKQVEYYTDIMGLTVTGKEKDAVFLASTVDQRDDPHHFSPRCADEVDDLANAPTCGNHVFNDEHTGSCRHRERPAKDHASFLPLAEDELDAERLRNGETDDEATDCGRRDKIDLQAFRKPLNCGFREKRDQSRVLEDARALHIRV